MRKHRLLLLILCVPAILWIACWPFVHSAVNDDFSYAFAVKRLLDTGTLTYNGWSSAMLGPQVVWGAAFAWAFGFSHDVLRVSMLPIATACAGLTYALHRRLAIPPAASAFATLLLITSPLFVAWSASFMTDLPGLLFTLLIFHAILSGMHADRFAGVARSAGWLVLFGLLGGTVRQTNFVMALVGLLMMVLRHRRQAASVATLLIAGAGHVAAVAWLVRWHARQPYSVPELWPELTDYLSADASLLLLLLELALYLLPLAVVIARASRLRRTTLIGLLAAMLVAGFSLHLAARSSSEAGLFRALWIGNTLTPTGLLASRFDAPGDRPIVFPDAVRVVAGAAVFWFVALLVVLCRREEAALVRAFRRMRAEPGAARLWTLSALLAIAVVYLALLFPRAALGFLFDRYLLVVFPIATATVLCLAGERVKTLRLAWTLLPIYALVGVACTRDHFAELRAREEIAAELRKDGLPRTAIANGLAYDAWTQLESKGYINEPRIQEPADAYVHDPDTRRVKRFWFLNRTPAVEPRWIVENVPTRPTAEAGERIYSYGAVLPPFERWLLVKPFRLPPATQGRAVAEPRERQVP